MHLEPLVLFVAGILLCIDAATANSRLTHPTIAKRSVRIDTKDKVNEARTLAVLSRLINARPPRPTDSYIQRWKKEGKSADEVFALLKLDEVGENLFANPKLKTWLNYMSKTNNVQTKMAIVSSLSARYGDDVLAKMLEAAKKVPGTKDIATKLQTEQMWIWLQSGKSIDDVSSLLKLDAEVDKLLANPNFNVWDNYIKFFNRYKGGKKETTINALMALYGDEAVAKMLQAAKQQPGTTRRATKLQSAQFEQWLREDAKPAEIWKMVKMEKKTWMTNPDAEIWRGYLAFYKSHKTATV